MNWTGTIWQGRTTSGRRTLVYRLGNGSIGMVKRHAVQLMPDCRLRPIRGLEDERRHAGDRDIADGMFNATETLETPEVSTDRAIAAVALR